jgi:hypothetical protein
MDPWMMDGEDYVAPSGVRVRAKRFREGDREPLRGSFFDLGSAKDGDWIVTFDVARLAGVALLVKPDVFSRRFRKAIPR